MAPCKFARLQYKAASIKGPNDAPKPAQAYDTTLKMEEFSSIAIKIPNNKITTSVILATINTEVSLAFFFSKPLYMLLETAEPASSNYDDAEDIVAAKIPDITTPAINDGSRI